MKIWIRVSISFSRVIIAKVVSVAVLILLTSYQAAAADSEGRYIYYLRPFGDWSVFCASVQVDPGGVVAFADCTLTAQSGNGGPDSTTIEVSRGAPDEAAVAVRARHELMPESVVYLRVDGNPAHQAIPDNGDAGAWTGAQAQRILGELNGGEAVVVRTFSGPPPVPRDVHLSLAEFSAALTDFSAKVGLELPADDALPPPPAASAAFVPGAGGDDPDAAANALPAEGGQAAAADMPDVSPELAGASDPPNASDAAIEVQSSANSGVSILDPHVGRAQLTSAVVNREPVDALGPSIRTSPSGQDYVHFFTELRDLAGETVTHRWMHNGEVAASVPFRIGGQRWRVYSRKAIAPEQAGSWTVTAVGSGGEVLARAAFIAE